MEKRLSGKRTLLIGAATGIGRECALAFAREGAALCVADINANGAKAVAAQSAEISPNAFALDCDVRDEESVKTTVSAAEEKLGGLDTLVFLAGLMHVGTVDGFETGEWDDIFAVNVRGTFLAAKYAAPALRRAGGGSIINTSSLAGLRAAPGMTAYGSAKGAVIAFSTALALELAPDLIRVNSVLPGWVDTPFNGPAIELMGGVERHAAMVRQAVPLGRQATADEVAPLYVFLASEESRYITGKQHLIDGGMAH